ncbi:MAG: hypothetical protein CVV56_01180 [Tenericutes bacterium HGW-Tenericutes-1]|jgi:uncharacterized protein YjdB|nr:MAG: hypothetical protein CVV56_01180 [Tenericutes bacterium HGW-Tenericutes-1]
MENQKDFTKTRWFALTSLILNGMSILVTISLGVLSFFLVKSVNTTINENNNNQEIVTLQPRDGDVIIQEGDSYKLLQLIKIEDIEFTPLLQETRYDKNYNIDNRVDLFNDNNQDWDDRVSFGYTIEKISINADKIMNLHNNISSITAYIDFYESSDITTRLELTEENAFKIVIFEKDTNIISNTVINSKSRKTYVTNAQEIIPNNGVNYAKIRIEIRYQINDMIFSSSILSNDWLIIKED